MSFQRRPRAFGPRNRGVWILLIVMLVVLALSCCAGLMVSIAQQGGDDPAPAESPSAKAAAAAPGRLTVPNLVGVRLPDAEEKLTALGFGNPRVEDSSGRDRPVLSRANWVVRSQDPKPGASVAGSTTVTLRVSKPTDTAPTGAPSEGVVPDVVCRDLQAAQDAMQAAGFFVLASADGTGQGRRQFVDRNWVVTDQSVKAGTRPVRSTRVLLTVVKIGEANDACAS
ncbi:PASTA domain-containing protein [Cryptosporangium arvum]|uniref:PASTA domain-containing protein n=1 Tax=Cryptosporangium arvum TaxID=80871 RepID=UPI0004B6D211|nr:PASTA domain-containing protein [Cryptosporangium arvum]